MNEDLTREIEELKNWKASLEKSSSIPLNIDQAFRERFSSPVVSTKTADSESIAVNSATTTAVLKEPDAFVKITVNGIVYNLPAYL